MTETAGGPGPASAGAESGADDGREIEPEDPETPMPFGEPDLSGGTDVPGSEIEDDSDFVEDVAVFSHLDDELRPTLDPEGVAPGGGL